MKNLHIKFTRKGFALIRINEKNPERSWAVGAPRSFESVARRYVG